MAATLSQREQLALDARTGLIATPVLALFYCGAALALPAFPLVWHAESLAAIAAVALLYLLPTHCPKLYAQFRLLVVTAIK